MSAATHTPGPWETRRNSLGGLEGAIYPKGAKHPCVWVTGYYESAGNTIGNLLLTATAPELLEAAQAVVARWDTPLWKDAPATAESINALRAAIAKATGAAT